MSFRCQILPALEHGDTERRHKRWSLSAHFEKSNGPGGPRSLASTGVGDDLLYSSALRTRPSRIRHHALVFGLPADSISPS